jgi:glycoprotein-N-acetylgalactosamine 3-beta-galactosyltransferase
MKKLFFRGTFIVVLIIILISSYGIEYNIKVSKLDNKHFRSYDDLVHDKSVYPKIFCMIITHPGNINTKAKTVFDAWATKCDKYKFISVIPDEWLNESNVFISNETKLLKGFEFEYQNLSYLQPINYTIDHYKTLTDKIFQTFKYLYKNYNDYDFFLKADDDTFVFVDNLRKFLRDKNRSSPVTYGWDFRCMKISSLIFIFFN